ncbi:MAG: histidine--tRNA ligase [Eggerthellaceae bacterium]|nr:histidine--tRNA ligase [Eggerthellaceae bacterium]
MAIKKPTGTKDLLFGEAQSWRDFQNLAFEHFAKFGYIECYLPTFEQTELFVRGMGVTTDVVNKEMFHVLSSQNLRTAMEAGSLDALKVKNRLSLRPEGTAGVVRCVIENNLVLQGAAPVKLAYAGSMFRAERPQSGRFREFYQLGVECIGSDSVFMEAECIIMLAQFLEDFGIKPEITCILINSIGCEKCRDVYRKKLVVFLKSQESKFCEECYRRAETNPLRVFDCKKLRCVAVMKDAPTIDQYICEDCRKKFEQLKKLLKLGAVQYVEAPHLVRGLDYYTANVFEVQVDSESTGLGAQNAIGGGGAYAHLVKDLGGSDLPGFGFALGYERCVLALGEVKVHATDASTEKYYVACVDENLREHAFEYALKLRTEGKIVEIDSQGRSLKSQFKQADKFGANFVVILGPEELADGQCRLHNMQTHEETLISL